MKYLWKHRWWKVVVLALIAVLTLTCAVFLLAVRRWKNPIVKRVNKPRTKQTPAVKMIHLEQIRAATKIRNPMSRRTSPLPRCNGNRNIQFNNACIRKSASLLQK